MRINMIAWKECSNDCWYCISHGISGNGYPVITRNRKMTTVARFLYEECFGEIPEGMMLRHKCDNKKCINIEHMELGTAKQNMEDMVNRGRSLCGEKHHKAKLTWKQVTNIRKEHQPNKRLFLSKKYGVSETTIQHIVNNISWNTPFVRVI